MLYFNFSLILGGAISLFSGYFTYIKNRKEALNQSWFLMSIASVFWSFGYFVMINAPSKEIAWISNYVLQVGVMLVLVLFFRFILILTGKINKKKYRRLLFLLSGITVFFIIFNFTKFFVDDMVPRFIFNYVCNAGPLYYLFFINFCVWTLISLIILFSSYKESTGAKAQQIKYVLLSMIGFVGGASTFPLHFNINIPPYTIIFYSLYPLVIFYSIIRHRLMGINVVLSKFYLYIIVACIPYAVFNLTIYIEEHFLGGLYSTPSLIFGPFVSIVFSVCFIPFYEYVQGLADRIFFGNHNPKKIIKDLTIKLNNTTKLKEIFRILIEEFEIVLNTKEICILTLCNNGKKIKKRSKPCFLQKRKIKANNIIFDVDQMIIENELKLIKTRNNAKLAKELKKYKIEIIIPLISDKKKIGMIFLGQKDDLGAYTQGDLEFLETLTPQIAIAVENARLHDEIEDFNKNLQKRVDKQTKEIREKAEHLQKLLTVRSEFLDIASHQLRTPSSVIKGVLSMVHEGSLPPEKQKELLDAAFQKSLKLEEIIDEILRASEMDSEKFNLQLVPLSITKILDEIYQDKLNNAAIKNLEFKIDIPPKVDLVLSDPIYIKHIVRNLINNAIQYTNEGSITIRVVPKKNTIDVEVIDTGIGIPKQDINKLFQKFSRAENAVMAYANGSGLGLFIVKKIIDAHKGASVKVKKTELGRGTTFVLTLPIAFDALVK